MYILQRETETETEPIILHPNVIKMAIIILFAVFFSVPILLSLGIFFLLFLFITDVTHGSFP